MPFEIADVIADAAHPELAEVGEVLADLRGVQVELFGERLRGDGPDAGAFEQREAAQVDRQAVGRELGDLIEALFPLRRLCQRFVHTFHKRRPIVAKC
jgi:hypothetical protein